MTAALPTAFISNTIEFIDKISAYLLKDPLSIFLIGISLLILFFWYFASEIELRKRNIGSILLVGLTALCLIAIIPPKEKLKGGIDIVGGASFSMQIKPKKGANNQNMPITKEQVDQAKIVIENRLRAIGYPEATIYQQGDNGLLLQIPGVEPEEAEKIRLTLKKVAKLELHKVSERSNEPANGGKTLAQSVLDGDEIVVGQRAYKYVYTDSDGNEITEAILLYRRSALGGKDIANAVPSPSRSDAVAITLNGPGTDKMIALTDPRNIREGIDRIAIVLDGKVVSAPTVVEAPLGKNFEINGLTDPGEKETLAKQLMNPLENPLDIGEMRIISPTLGEAVVTQGLVAGASALALTYLFMLLYYRVSGVVAAVSLTVCGVLLFGFMGMFGFTFSLPGIAGMVLTVGMAVDANVLIYERMREEFAAGKDTRLAINSAYDKAFSAIFDSNITTLITACILFILGSGAIKSFAITLIIGLSASMFAAILGTRTLYRWGMDIGAVKKLSFMNLIRATKFDFMGKRRAYAVVGIGLILISIGGMTAKKDTMMGIDFTGGTTLTYQLGEKNISLDEIKKSIGELTLTKQAYPQTESNPSSGLQVIIRCATKDAVQINDQLRANFDVLGEKKEDGNYVIATSKDEVSSAIGGNFLKQAIIAVICGLIGIMLYMTARFEFSFALGGFVAMLHDIIIALGVVVILGSELSLIHVGAILTIAGYSINDTIIVFDRIRETLLIRSGSIINIMNEAINATLSRTLITSGTTITTVAILTIFGGAALRDFGLIILIGIIVGTFSSIFVASPIVLWWSKRSGRSIREEVLETTARAEAAAQAP